LGNSNSGSASRVITILVNLESCRYNTILSEYEQFGGAEAQLVSQVRA